MLAAATTLTLLATPAAASAATRQSSVSWAKKYSLSGKWKTKDADRDGLKNFDEFKQGTNPRRADSDRDGLRDGDEVLSGNDPLVADSDGDGIRDGAEHAGVVLSFDGVSVVLRQFRGAKLSGILEACEPDADLSSVPADETDWEDDGGADDWSDDWSDADVSDDYDEVDDIDICALEPGDVVNQAEVETRDGAVYFTALELAD